MALQGSLRDMAVADLIQQNCQDRKAAQVTLTRANQTATLFFQDGNLVHAALDDLRGEEAVYALLGWETGQFISQTGVAPPAKTIKRKWTGLLLEGARRLDEAQVVSAPPQDAFRMEAQAMDLNNLLKELGEQVEGFQSAAVVGMDGMPIAQFARSKKNDPEVTAAQMTLLVKLVDTSVTRLNAGIIEDNLLTTDNAYILTRLLKDRGYYLALVAERKTAQLGSLRLNSRIYADRIDKAMPR